jgi:hypothetical protein
LNVSSRKSLSGSSVNILRCSDRPISLAIVGRCSVFEHYNRVAERGAKVMARVVRNADSARVGGRRVTNAVAHRAGFTSAARRRESGESWASGRLMRSASNYLKLTLRGEFSC